MGELAIWEKLKEWIGGIGFDLFIWSNDMTQDQYFKAIYEQEKDRELNPEKYVESK